MTNNQNTGLQSPQLLLLSSPDWEDYALLDSGRGRKLERYGSNIFVRPEPQALWEPTLPASRWVAAHAEFIPGGGESGGAWQEGNPYKHSWTMRYKRLLFGAQVSASRHLGVFPEQAPHWDWLAEIIQKTHRPVKVLNLFAYTGLATLAAAQAGAQVTHVDASRNAINLARQNQALSGLEERPIRWLVDDAYKFVRREVRRQSKYDGLILDQPKFGRGPQGQVWEFFKALPALLETCRLLLSDQPLFVVLTAYAIRASALNVYYALREIVSGLGGSLEAGELALIEQSAGRMLSMALFARWSQ
jgi:23S rRNA (cytosine1962-C5)-methyltransferase